MKKPFLLLGLLFLSINVFAQDFQWAKQMGGSLRDQGRCVAVDAEGNSYTIGLFMATVDFDPGNGTYNLAALGSPGNPDIFVSKLNSAGDWVWTKQFGGTGNDTGRFVCLDAAGNIYITGLFSGTVDFDPGIDSFILNAAGEIDAFIVKLNSNGDFVWAGSFGGTSVDDGFSISIDASENVYLTGWFYGTADFDPGSGTHNFTSAGGGDIFILKLNASGNLIWANQIGDSGDEIGFHISNDAFGFVYVTGFFANVADFDPGTAVYNLSSAGLEDMYITKLDSTGNFVWAKRFGGTGSDGSRQLALDAEANVYVTGGFAKTVDFDPGPGLFNLTSAAGSSDAFLLKLDSDGNFNWVKNFGGGNNDSGRAVKLDSGGNIYLSGIFTGTVDFDPNAGIYNLTEGGIYILKLDTAGSFVWANSIPGLDWFTTSTMGIDPTGNIYVTGAFEITIDFDPTGGIFNLTPNGIDDAFIVKISQSSPTGVNPVRSADLPVHIYPNPAANEIYLQAPVSGKVRLELYDDSGRLVLAQSFVQIDEVHDPLKINIETLQSGVYLLKMSDGKRSFAGKIIKCR